MARRWRCKQHNIRRRFLLLCSVMGVLIILLSLPTLMHVKTIRLQAFSSEIQFKFGLPESPSFQKSPLSRSSPEIKPTEKPDGKKENNSLKQFTTTKLPVTLRKSTEGRKYIVYQCDHTRWCGGFGDRQRGLVSTFIFSQVLNRSFLLNMTTPCNFNRFFTPNEVQWDIDPADLEGLSERTLQTFSGRNDLYPTIINGSFDSIFHEDVIRIKTNGDLVNQIRQNGKFSKRFPSWVNLTNYGKTLKTGWNLLVKPSVHLQEHYSDLFKHVAGPDSDKNLVCAHVRMARNPTMPNDGESRFDVKDMDMLWNFVASYVSNGSYFFLATDSEQVRKLSRARFKDKMIDTNGKILHIDRQRGNKEACDAFEVAVLEQLILSRCRVLVTCPSNFSRRAKEIRGFNKDLFYFDRKGVRPDRVER